ncbi:hypothetical protein JYU16_02260 [bacterium AH-315-M05]|nr:hypothetical protein [bacterium AH-315-M05]
MAHRRERDPLELTPVLTPPSFRTLGGVAVTVNSEIKGKHSIIYTYQ